MTTYTISGNTFPYRDIIKSYGGRWNASAQHWTADGLSPSELTRLRALLGVVVAEYAPTRQRPPELPKPIRGPTVCYGDDTTYLNYFADQNPPAFFGFSSLRGFVDYVAGLDMPPDFAHRRAGWETGEKRVERVATRDLPEALRLARDGWSDGLGIFDKLEIPRAHHKQRLRSVAGGTVSVGRMLAGNPAHMIRRAKLPGHRIITLFVQTSMWSRITVWNALLRAWLICAITDQLEADGYRCDIVAVRTVINPNGDTGPQHAIKIKDARDRLNIADISFALGHPSFNRRLCFASCGASNACASIWDGMGGLSAAFDDDHEPGRNEFYIPGLMPYEQADLDDTNPFDMLRFIQPDGLPVKLKER